MGNKLAPEYLLLNFSLYEGMDINDGNLDFISTLLSDEKSNQIDCYCVECKKDSTFRKQFKEPINDGKAIVYSSLPVKGNSSDSLNNELLSLEIQGFHQLKYFCQRNLKHEYVFNFKVAEQKITKIGQYPSMADIELHGIEKYRKILSKEYRDFSKAIGLNSHGIGIGSFVYLRRIFENLIEETRTYALESGSSFDNESFQKSRMDEKIKLLDNHLPDILVQNRQIYSILSKGIHELTEEECKEMFPNVKLAIELILDEKLAKKEKESKTQQLRKFVSSTMGKYKS